MAEHLATIGKITAWDLTDVPDVRPALRLVCEHSAILEPEECIALARLLVKFAAQHGSDLDRERIIAWAQVKK